MSLSNEERLRGIYNCLNELRRVDKDWNDCRYTVGYLDRSYKDLRSMLKQLWPAFLNAQTNSGFWIMGGSSGSVIGSEVTTPWQVAISAHIQDAIVEEPEWRADREEPFDALKFVNKVYLLRHAHYGYNLSYTMEVYEITERLIYYLRRYDDDMLAAFSKLSSLVSSVCGECFMIFSGHEEYAKAYIIHEIMPLLYGPGYPWNDESADVVTKLMVKNHVHHDFTSLMKRSLKELTKHHIALVQCKLRAESRLGHDNKYQWHKDSEMLKLRLIKMIELTKSFGGYEHTRKAAVMAITEAGVMDDDIESAIKAAVVSRNKRKEDESKECDDRWREDALAVYGYSSYDLMKDALKGVENGNLEQSEEASVGQEAHAEEPCTQSASDGAGAAASEPEGPQEQLRSSPGAQ